MEATSDYWKGPFYRLEAEGFECVLADAKQVKNLPGRPKRDPADSRWLAACFERGAVTACFVATPEFRIIRLHTRYRRDLTEERTREKQRAEKLLESAAIKISSVLTDLHGVTGRDIMDHLIAGERNPKVLAQLARAAARRKISQLEEALEGAEFFTAEHAALLAKVLARIDRLSADIEDLTAGDRAAAGPVRGTAAAGRVDARLGPARRPGRRRRNRRRHDQVPHRAAPVLLGRPRPARPPVRQARRTRQSQERQPVPRRHPRRDRRGGRPHPDPRRRPPPAAGPKTRHGQSMRRHREHPAEGLPQAAVQPRHALRRTSARTTTSASATPAARSPTTSASSDPSASKSPSAASPNPTQTEQARPRPPDPYRPRRP